MAVVINDFEMIPAQNRAAPPADEAKNAGGAKGKPDAQEMERWLRTQKERRERVRAH